MLRLLTGIFLASYWGLGRSLQESLQSGARQDAAQLEFLLR